MLKIGKDKYEIQDKIGQGRYGSVYRGLNKETGEVVAIKAIEYDKDDIDHIKYIWREILIMKKLSEFKNNIFTTKLYDVIEADCSEK